MNTWVWIGFVVLVLGILAVDLILAARHPGPIKPRKALLMTSVFVVIALFFAGAIYAIYDHGLMGPGKLAHDGVTPLTGRIATIEYLSTWLLEYSLSVDNLFVFTLIFTYFKVPDIRQHRVLFWGIMGALVLRGIMITLGAELIHQFHWILYLFGLLLLYTAYKLVASSDEEFDPSQSRVVRWVRKVFPITPELRDDKFFVRESLTPGGAVVLAATPLFLVLVVVEATDVMFALDSIPAAFGQSREPFIIFSSNVFAIMGLRSLYFALAGLMSMFKFLKLSLALILAFVGVKMLIEEPVAALGWPGLHIGGTISLAVIATALTAGVTASIMVNRRAVRLNGGVPPARGH